jgi:hypothetical protein
MVHSYYVTNRKVFWELLPQPLNLGGSIKSVKTIVEVYFPRYMCVTHYSLRVHLPDSQLSSILFTSESPVMSACYRDLICPHCLGWGPLFFPIPFKVLFSPVFHSEIKEKGVCLFLSSQFQWSQDTMCTSVFWSQGSKFASLLRTLLAINQLCHF